MNKQLTEAQKKHLIALNDQVVTARQQLETFLGYLREEHNAPPEKFGLSNINDGFVEIPKETK
jgi:hypothetical protein